MRVIFFVLVALSSFAVATWQFAVAASPADPWNHKAVSSLQEASKIVGGFSSMQTRLYETGLLHIQHQHQRPGQFTIGQVIREERAREIKSASRSEARPAAPAGKADASGAIGFVIVIIVATGLVMFIASLSSRRALNQQAELQANNQAIHDDIANQLQSGGFPPLTVPISLQENERCVYTIPSFYAVMTSVDHGSTGIGLSFRVARGVRLGTYHRLPMPKDLRMVSEDFGDIYLTDKRVLFVGRTTSASFNWSRVLKSTPFVDGVRYDISNHRPVQFRTGNIAAGLMSAILQGGSSTQEIPDASDGKATPS